MSNKLPVTLRAKCRLTTTEELYRAFLMLSLQWTDGYNEDPATTK